MKRSILASSAMMALAAAGIALSSAARTGLDTMFGATGARSLKSRTKYTGRQLREIRARNGVGRPPHLRRAA